MNFLSESTKSTCCDGEEESSMRRRGRVKKNLKKIEKVTYIRTIKLPNIFRSDLICFLLSSPLRFLFILFFFPLLFLSFFLFPSPSLFARRRTVNAEIMSPLRKTKSYEIFLVLNLEHLRICLSRLYPLTGILPF